MNDLALFDFNNDKDYHSSWVQQMPDSYKGLILPGSYVRGIEGVFGHMLFQCRPYKRLALWYNSYSVQRRLKTHARLERPIIEMSLVLDQELEFTLSPFKTIKPKSWQFNILYTPYMDNKTQFESFAKFMTLDIHFDLSILEMLFEDFPDQIGPLLDSVYNNKPMLYFTDYLYASPAMVSLIFRIINIIKSSVQNEALVEFLSCRLLLEGMNINKGHRYCALPFDVALEMEALIEYGIGLAMADKIKYKGNPYYAARCFMSNTTFKKYVKLFKGRSLKSMWQDARLERALDCVLHSDEPIEKIASQFGFASPAHFRIIFLKRYGDMPIKLRRMAKGCAPGAVLKM